MLYGVGRKDPLGIFSFLPVTDVSLRKSLHEGLDSVVTLIQHHAMEEIPPLGLKSQFYMTWTLWALS